MADLDKEPSSLSICEAGLRVCKVVTIDSNIAHSLGWLIGYLQQGGWITHSTMVTLGYDIPTSLVQAIHEIKSQISAGAPLPVYVNQFLSLVGSIEHLPKEMGNGEWSSFWQGFGAHNAGKSFSPQFEEEALTERFNLKLSKAHKDWLEKRDQHGQSTRNASAVIRALIDATRITERIESDMEPVAISPTPLV